MKNRNPFEVFEKKKKKKGKGKQKQKQYDDLKPFYSQKKLSSKGRKRSKNPFGAFVEKQERTKEHNERAKVIHKELKQADDEKKNEQSQEKINEWVENKKKEQGPAFGYSKKQKQINFQTQKFPGVLEVDALLTTAKKKPEINPLLPQIDFMVTYIAPRNSGKTNNLVTFLIKPDFCFKKFDYIFIWSSTFFIDRTWKLFRKKYKVGEHYTVFQHYDADYIKNLFSTIEQDFVEHEKDGTDPPFYLFIWDDMGDENICSNYNVGGIEKVAVKGRHYNVSGIILVQKRTMLSRAIRTNTTNCIIFDLTDNKEMQVCSEESRGDLTHDEFMHIYKYCTHEKHNFLHINYQVGKNERYRKNWNEIIYTELEDQ
jgi:hypothetical protein